MKKIIVLFFLLLYIKGESQCPNGDIEQGNFNNFTRMQGSFSDPLNLMLLNPFPVQTGIPAQFRQEIINVPTGPHSIPDITIPQITLTDEGLYCIRVNNHAGALQKDGVYYTFQVTPANAIFKFKYAMVLQDPGSSHTPQQKPFVTFFMNVLYNCPGKNIPHVPPIVNFNNNNNFGCPNSFLTQKILDYNLFTQTIKSKVADANDPFFKIGLEQTVYKNWQCVQYDLTQYIGQTVSLCVLAAGCSLNQHYGYLYLDGLCKPNIATANFNLSNTTFCSNSNMIMNGAASVGEDRYFLEIAESDAQGNLIPNGDIKSWWTLGVEVPNGINIKNEYVNHGGAWKCNAFYKIKLAVMSDCAPWNSKEQVIKYSCPELPVLPNQFSCCKLKLGGVPCFNLTVPNPLPGYTYNWSSTAPTGINYTGPNAVHCSKQSNIFNLSVTDANGCTGVTTTTIFIQGNLNASLNLVNLNQSCGENSCNIPPVTVNKNVTPCVPGQSEIFNSLMQSNISNYWVNMPFFNWQGSGSSFSPGSAGNYAAVVQTSCEHQILPFTAIAKFSYTPSLIAANSFAPNSSNPQTNKLIIFDLNTNAPNFGQGPAYGQAIDFELLIFDSFGGLFRTIHKSDIGLAANDCLKQGDIQWDGKDQNGNIVQQDTYTFCLRLKLCNGTWHNWDVNTGEPKVECIRKCKKFNFWPPKVIVFCCESCQFAKHVNVFP